MTPVVAIPTFLGYDPPRTLTSLTSKCKIPIKYIDSNGCNFRVSQLFRFFGSISNFWIRDGCGKVRSCALLMNQRTLVWEAQGMSLGETERNPNAEGRRAIWSL